MNTCVLLRVFYFELVQQLNVMFMLYQRALNIEMQSKQKRFDIFIRVSLNLTNIMYVKN